MKVVERARFIFPNGGELKSLMNEKNEPNFELDPKKYNEEVYTVKFGEEWPPASDTWDE